jgi:hypothetical protein
MAADNIVNGNVSQITQLGVAFEDIREQRQDKKSKPRRISVVRNLSQQGGICPGNCENQDLGASVSRYPSQVSASA